MYRSTVKTERFDMDNETHLRNYDAILNNPLCILISEKDEKISDREMGAEGNIVAIHDRMVKVITFKEKSFL